MPDEDLATVVAELRARVEALEDDRAIRQLLARYGITADMGRIDAYVDLYTDDGAIDGAGDFRREGRAELTRFITDTPTIDGRHMHLQGNNLVTHIEGDNAVAESYSVVLVREGDGLRLMTANVNRWTLKKIDGEWHIRERLIRVPGTEDYTNVLAAEGYTESLR